MRVAAIDCGTNSIRLLVADVDPDPDPDADADADADARTLVDVERTMEIVRLGQDVDRTGRLAPEALVRTFAACDRYGDRIRALGAERVRFVATSASRDAENRDEFVEGVLARIHVAPEVVPGSEEAALSFLGATRELAGREATPFLVVDIGGGSTEFAFGTSRPDASLSVDIGCVRLTERHLTSDPPRPAEIAAARADIEAGIDLAAAAVPLADARTLVGLAGSVTTLAAMDAGLATYDETVTHHYRLRAAAVHELTERLLATTRADRARIPVMHPGRIDVIGAGALILSAIVERVGVDEVLVSEHDILDGIAWSLT